MRPPSVSCSWLKRRSFSAMAVYMRTGAFTRPKEMAPVQTARGRLEAGMVCKDTSIAGISLPRPAAPRKLIGQREGRGLTPYAGRDSFVAVPFGVRPRLLAGDQREHARVGDQPGAVVVAPEELDHAGVAVGEVQMEERAIRHRADQLGAIGTREQRSQLVVACGDMLRSLTGRSIVVI